MAAAWSPSELPEWFWKIVESAQADPGRLAAALADLSDRRIAEFQAWFEDAALELATEEHEELLEEAGLTSEDHLHDWASTIIWQGRKLFERVFAEPESMPPVSVIDTWPDLQGVAGRVYHERTGRSLHEEASRILEARDARSQVKRPAAPKTRTTKKVGPATGSGKKSARRSPKKRP